MSRNVPRSQMVNNRENHLRSRTKDSKESLFQISVDNLCNTKLLLKHPLPQQISCYLPATVLENNVHIMQDWGKTSGSDQTPEPVSANCCRESSLQTNVDLVELIWEEFTQGIQTFFSHKASHKASLKNPKKKMLYLGKSQFVPKGESVEVFGMAIPDPLITEAIQQSSYYPKYLKMVAENTKKTPQESASMQPATKRATPKKPTTTTPVKQTKPAPPPSKKPSKRKLPQKVRKGKPTFQLVDEDDEAQQESNPQEEGNDPELELAKKLSLETHQEKGEGEGDDADLERAIKLSLDPAFLPQGRAPVGGVTIRDPVSETTPKLHEVVGKGKAVVTEEQVAHSPDSIWSKKKRTTDQDLSLLGVIKLLLFATDPLLKHDDDTSEKVIYESSSTSDSERTESETETAAPKMTKIKVKVDTSTVTISRPKPEHIDEKSSLQPTRRHQTVTSTPPVIAPFTKVSYSKPSLLVTPSPINTEATTITTSLPEITPFIALQLRVARLEQEMSEVEED
ncbi:hypothetical protein Tco_1194434 [Tanacetum coccineum]